jgi:hypothetical protein
MRFYGAADAYGWYLSRRFELDHPGPLSRHLYGARGAVDTAIALADLERLLSRLGRNGRKALKNRTADFPTAVRHFEGLLREASYLH